jgi:hypothetical protein
MNTRSRQRKQKLQDSDLQTLNGSIATPPDSPTKSASSRSVTDGKRKTRRTSDSKTSVKAAPIKVRKGIYRVPIATWNFFVRKWEVPRKTLHVSIGNSLKL